MKVAQALYEFTRVYRNEEKIDVQLSDTDPNRGTVVVSGKSRKIRFTDAASFVMAVSGALVHMKLGVGAHVRALSGLLSTLYVVFKDDHRRMDINAQASNVYDAYRYFASAYNANPGVDRLEVRDFSKNVENGVWNEWRPIRAVVRVFRNESEASSTAIAFSDDADFIMAVTDALRVPASKMSESAHVLMLTAAMETLYRIHKERRKLECAHGQCAEDGGRSKDECTIL
jgi:hypothetical protein